MAADLSDPVLVLQWNIPLAAVQQESSAEVRSQLDLSVLVEVGDTVVEELVEVEVVSHQELQAGGGAGERLVHRGQRAGGDEQVEGSGCEDVGGGVLLEYGDSQLGDDGVDGRTGELGVSPVDVVKQTPLKAGIRAQRCELAVKRDESSRINPLTDIREEDLEIVPGYFTHTDRLTLTGLI